MQKKLSNLEFYVSNPYIFSGFKKPIDEAKYIIVGIPLDKTSTYRPGSRFAPLYIREASLNIETYSLSLGIDLEDLSIHDAGDLHIVENLNENLNRISLVVKDIVNLGKIPILIGGEHTITYGAISAFDLKRNIGLLCFDAHADLRDEYMGEKISHATFMKRVVEKIGAEKLMLVGLRALSKEEAKFLHEAKISYIKSEDLRLLGFEKVYGIINSKIKNFDKIYLSIDMDVLDPAFAPGVGNPESNGIDSYTILNLIRKVCNEKILGIDLVEVLPNYDTGITSILSARILFEALCALEKSSKIGFKTF
ncbi:MAG: agmatinase [Candidatus Bathyarchaeia archaeon]